MLFRSESFQLGRFIHLICAQGDDLLTLSLTPTRLACSPLAPSSPASGTYKHPPAMSGSPADPRPPEPEQNGGGDGYAYLSGLGNSFSSEAVQGSLPANGHNSPLLCPLGLYAEQLSGTSFTTPRHRNLRTWMYRIKPSVTHDPFHPRDPPNPRLLADFHDPRAALATPTQLRWRPADLPPPDGPPELDFIDGLYTVCGAGSSFLRHGFAVHMYAANKSMDGCAFCNADGDFLIVPQQGSQSSGLRPVKFRHNALSFCTYQPVALFMLDWNYLTYPAAQPPFGITNQ